MPQLDFYLCEDDRMKVVEFAFSIGCKIVPNKHYITEKYELAMDRNSYLKYCKESTLLFFLSNKYSFYSLEFDFFDNQEGRKYFIKQKYGGPSIDFFSPIVAEIEDNIVGPGFIGIYPFYYINNNKRIVPTSEFKNVYNLLVSFIRKISTKAELLNRTYWIGNNTIKRVKNKELTLLPISNIDILSALE